MRSLYYGIRNLVRWSPVIWRDRDWDWCFLARMMEHKLRRMAHLELTCGHHTTSARDGKRMLVCAELLRRLQADEYNNNAGVRRAFWTMDTADRLRIYQHADRMREQDATYFGRLLGKHMLGWWD